MLTFLERSTGIGAAAMDMAKEAQMKMMRECIVSVLLS
jgi:hypothetical protein